MFAAPLPLPWPPPCSRRASRSSSRLNAESSAHMNFASVDSLDAPTFLAHPSLSRSVFHTLARVSQFWIQSAISSGAHTLIKSKISASVLSNHFPKLLTRMTNSQYVLNCCGAIACHWCTQLSCPPPNAEVSHSVTKDFQNEFQLFEVLDFPDRTQTNSMDHQITAEPLLCLGLHKHRLWVCPGVWQDHWWIPKHFQSEFWKWLGTCVPLSSHQTLAILKLQSVWNRPPSFWVWDCSVDSDFGYR